ncbi:MAG: hypothetical protein IAF38_11975, partial [Bacteroidia bacterium]|nr:hypothetical protein [Bacteroidia bacterium]
IIFLFLSVFPAHTFGQLKGEYCHHYGFGSECITFLENNRFEYDYHDCTSIHKGKGIYKLNGQNLNLNFQTDSSNEKSGYVIAETKTSQNDSIEIKISCYDKKLNESLVFVTITFKNKKDSVIAGKATDLDGNCTIKFPRSSDSLTLCARYIGYEALNYILIPDKDYNLQVNMKTNFRKEYKSGETLNFKIRKITTRSIDLQPDYEKAPYEIYEKR